MTASHTNTKLKEKTMKMKETDKASKERQEKDNSSIMASRASSQSESQLLCHQEIQVKQ